MWVIAETDDLNTKVRKIVVTNDAGRFLLPELPRANYRVWVRGYGLVDSNACHGDGRAGSHVDGHRRPRRRRKPRRSIPPTTGSR